MRPGEVQPGVLTLYTDTVPWTINFPTKRHWRGRSRLEDIETGLVSLVRQYREWQIQSLAMPALGCGHGGLNWSDVRPLIEQHLSDLNIDIEVYEPAPAKAPDAATQVHEKSTTSEPGKP